MKGEIFTFTIIAIVIVLFAATLTTNHKECMNNGGTPVRGVFWTECVHCEDVIDE